MTNDEEFSKALKLLQELYEIASENGFTLVAAIDDAKHESVSYSTSGNIFDVTNSILNVINDNPDIKRIVLEYAKRESSKEDTSLN